MTRLPRLLGAVCLSLVSMLVTTSIVLAWSGQTNGRDLSFSPWIGNDNNDGVTGSYAPDNIYQDLILREWDEPYHDWIDDKFNRWGQAAEDKLDAESATKGLGFELTVHNQWYYDFTNSWNTNLPYSKEPENENPIEEAQQGYTEVDTEIQEPYLINVSFNYFLSYQLDAERTPTSTQPDFYSQIEYCDNNFLTNCFHDDTGWLQKVTLVK